MEASNKVYLAVWAHREMRWRVCQLVRLAAEHFDHVIFSAWGCGDFSLPAPDVAYLFRHAL